MQFQERLCISVRQLSFYCLTQFNSGVVQVTGLAYKVLGGRPPTTYATHPHNSRRRACEQKKDPVTEKLGENRSCVWVHRRGTPPP